MTRRLSATRYGADMPGYRDLFDASITDPAGFFSDTTGIAGNVTGVRVQMYGLSHNNVQDLDMLLTAPDGSHNLQFWSDAGDGAVNGITAFVRDDYTNFGGSLLPQGTLGSFGQYGAANYGETETAGDYGTTGGITTPSGSTPFRTAFTGAAAGGEWTLSIHDDTAGNTGTLDSWALVVETDSGSATVTGRVQRHPDRRRRENRSLYLQQFLTIQF